MTTEPPKLPPGDGPDLPEVEWAFAPVDKLAIGTALGITCGTALFLVTVYHLLLLDSSEGPNLRLLANYFAGYRVTWPGAFVGFFWGFVVGFVSGWFMAFLRNLFTALYTFRVRTKANLEKMADFLDHI
jgi:hypothetical protein